MDGTDLIMNGQIVLEGTVLSDDWCRWMDGGCFSARMVREALAELGGDVTVLVNSGGGDPFEGEAIRAAFQSHDGNVRVVVQGVAASAASLMIMSADEIVMSAGSFVMIHDPSSCVCGTSDDHGQEAARLDILADAYAGVYAGRSGEDTTAVRADMRATIWLNADDALARGYADSVLGAEEEPAEGMTMALAQTAHVQSMSALQMCATKAEEKAVPRSALPTAASSQQPPQSGTTMEVHMDPEDNVTEPTAVTPPQVPSQTDVQMSIDSAVTAERQRARQIRDAAAPFMAAGQLTAEQVNGLIDAGTPADQASTQMLTMMAGATPIIQWSGPAGARITRDETDTRLEGMISALMGDFDGPGQDFRGMGVRSLAMELSGSSRSFDAREQVRSGIVSTSMMGGAQGVSDFSYITTEVMNRRVLAEYERRGQNWNLVTGSPMRANDFRELHAVRFGGDFTLKPLDENGEMTHAVLEDEAEGLKVERRGRKLALTFEAIVNDDMSLFDRLPREFVLSARVMESTMVWSLFRGNARLKSDNKALFHVDHNNLAAAGAAISTTSVGMGIEAMWGQTAFGSKDKDDFIQIAPDRLLVPPALVTPARQFTSATVPTKDDDGNPYKSDLTAHVVPNLMAASGGSDTAWYLVSSDLPPIQHATLNGYEAPSVETMEGMNPRGVTMNAEHIFGAAASDFRGAYMNPGAAG